MLDVQYRMHPAIAEYPSARFYEGKLKTGIAPEDRPLLKGSHALSEFCKLKENEHIRRSALLYPLGLSLPCALLGKQTCMLMTSMVNSRVLCGGIVPDQADSNMARC